MSYLYHVFSSDNSVFNIISIIFSYNLVKWHYLISKARDRETLCYNVRIIKTDIIIIIIKLIIKTKLIRISVFTERT